MTKLSEKEISFYIKNNCKLETRPYCSDCDFSLTEVYTDELYGQMFCKECLIKSLESDEDGVDELRKQMMTE